jgi:uncharacterized protein
MTTPPPRPDLGLDPATGQPLPPGPPRWDGTKPIAPIWHTVLIVVIILGFSYMGSTRTGSTLQGGTRILLYGGTFFFELILFMLIWIWIRRAGFSMRELIGGRWKSVESFLIDVAVAIGFFIVAAIFLVGVRIALGTLDIHNLNKQLADTKRTLGPLIPHTPLEAGLFVGLSVAAGLFEEIIFRGYLQRQIGALAGNAFLGILGSAMIFGLGHGYQGGRMMIVIGIYGALFGVLAHFWKSLRPGMMAHAFQDAYAGLALFFLTR